MKHKGKSLLSMLLAVLAFIAVLSEPAALAENGGVNYSVEILPEISVPKRSNTVRVSHDASWYTEDLVYERLMGMQSDYPEGKPWNNSNAYSNTYLWHGGEWDGLNLTYTGYGCAGFALIMSDAAFGTDIPIWQRYTVTLSTVRVGDMLRINNNTHSVIVLRVNDDSVTVAEGNYNSSIHWGRTLSASQVESADYVLTRWPGVPQPPTYTVSYDAAGGTGAPKSQTKTSGTSLVLSSAIPVKAGCFFLGWADDTGTAEVFQPGDIFTRDADTTLHALWAAPDLILPASLTEIGDEAFSGGAFTFVKLPEQVVSIGRHAFEACPDLEYIYIPQAAEDIHTDAFGDSEGLTVLGVPGSYAEKYAGTHGFDFIACP